MVGQVCILPYQGLTLRSEFSDDGSGFQTAYSSETSVQPEAPSWTHLWQDYRRLSRDMQRTSMSNVSPFNQHQYTEAEVRGRRLLAIPPSGRSRSTPRRPQVAAIQIRRVASTHNPRGPLPFLDTAFVNTPGGAVSPFASSSSSDSGHDPFAYGSDTYPYGNVVDHDQHSSPLGDPDRTPTLHTWVSPINDEDGHGGGFSVSANSHWYPWALPDSGACRPGSPRTDNFLTGGDCQPHWSSAYEDLVTPQSSFGTFPSEPHNNNMVSNFGSDSIIDPSSASARSGVELKRVLPLDTGDTSTSQILQRSPGSRRPRKFRTNVGSMAMAEACKKRRKRRDGALFVCEVQGCSGTFTARHNLRCMFFHWFLMNEN